MAHRLGRLLDRPGLCWLVVFAQPTDHTTRAIWPDQESTRSISWRLLIAAHPLPRDSAAIACSGSGLSVGERQGGCKRDKRHGLDSFSGEFWELRGAANLGREGSKSVDTFQMRYSERESNTQPSKSGGDRRIEQARRGQDPSRGDAQAGGSDPARKVFASGKVSSVVAVR